MLLLLLCLAASTLLHSSCGAATDVISQQLTAHGALGCPMYLPSGLITYSEKRREAGLAAWPMNAAIYTSRRALASDSSPNETNRPAASQVTAAPGIPAALISIITPQHTHIRTPLNGPLSGTARESRYQKVKTNPTILLKQETVSGSGITWATCKSASRSRQITMPVPHHSFFLQTGCPSCHPTNSVKALKALQHSRHNDNNGVVM